MKLWLFFLSIVVQLTQSYVKMSPKELANKASCKTLLSNNYHSYVDLGYDEERKEVMYSIKSGNNDRISGSFKAPGWDRCSIFSDPKNYIVCTGAEGFTVVSGDRQVHFKPNSDPDPTGFVLVQGKNNFVQWGVSSAIDVEEINLNKTTDLGTCDANDAETKEVCPFLKPALHQRELYHRAHAKKYGGMVYGDDYFTSQLDFWYPAVFYEGIVVLISTKSKGYGVVVDQKTDECYYLVDYKSFDEEKNIPGHDVEAAQKALNSLNPAHKAVRIPIFESAEQVASFREGLKNTIDYTIFRSRGFEQSGTLFLHLLAFATTCFLGGLVMCCGLAFKTGGAYDTINSKPVDIQEIARENFYAEISSSDDGEKSVGKKRKEKLDF